MLFYCPRCRKNVQSVETRSPIARCSFPECGKGMYYVTVRCQCGECGYAISERAVSPTSMELERFEKESGFHANTPCK